MSFVSNLLCCVERGENIDKSASPVKMNGKLKPSCDSTVDVASTKWLALKTINWTDDQGRSRKWDIASRTTKQSSGPDAVVIIPVLKSKKNDSIDTLLVEQFRPPIGEYTLEFPAGLVDPNEKPEATALRELREETGYIGTVDTSFKSSELSMSPGLSDETIQLIVVNVDLDDPKNQNPDQDLDDGESIVLKRVPLTVGLKEALGTSTCMPISLLYSFAVGMEMGLKYGKEGKGK